MDQEATTMGLLVKWVIKAFEGDKSYIFVLIQYRHENAWMDKKK